ncbi:SpvB/TcaC N-terminal domain-containing protein, partial [Pannonibacter tanglangensis]
PAPQVQFSGSYNGSFGYSIDLKVPGFRGLEPNLQLDYSSSLVTSYSAEDVLGAGWRLQGLSSIVRANARRGAPTFGETDIYLLDGRELVPCPDTTQAGCSAGGTHAVWQENFTRIRRDAGLNTWEVRSKDGTRYVYYPAGVFSTSGPTGDVDVRLAGEFRYLLAKKIDTSGNQVEYKYSCDDFVSCRVTSIDYGASQVVFHWQGRPDEVTFGAAYKLGRLSQRIGAIEVRSAGSLVRAYDLGYTQSVTTNRSMLTSVREYGRDAVITAGKVTAGTALPPYTFQYSGEAPGVKTHADG